MTPIANVHQLFDSAVSWCNQQKEEHRSSYAHFRVAEVDGDGVPLGTYQSHDDEEVVEDGTSADWMDWPELEGVTDTVVIAAAMGARREMRKTPQRKGVDNTLRCTCCTGRHSLPPAKCPGHTAKQSTAYWEKKKTYPMMRCDYKDPRTGVICCGNNHFRGDHMAATTSTRPPHALPRGATATGKGTAQAKPRPKPAAKRPAARKAGGRSVEVAAAETDGCDTAAEAEEAAAAEVAALEAEAAADAETEELAETAEVDMLEFAELDNDCDPGYADNLALEHEIEGRSLRVQFQVVRADEMNVAEAETIWYEAEGVTRGERGPTALDSIPAPPLTEGAIAFDEVREELENEAYDEEQLWTTTHGEGEMLARG